MSIAAEQRDRMVQGAIREISHIATLPEVTMKIIELVEDPKSTAHDLHDVIAGDPALCSRILKVVNSSFYGLPGQIGSINRAIVMLGLNAVKNIAIAASLAKLFRGGELTRTFSARDLWRHSNEVAAISKLLADELRFGMADEAFLAGLIHDIGIMVEMQYDRSRLIEAVEQVGLDGDGVPAISLLEVEDVVFGATHEHFGKALCERWKFPRSFAMVTGHHHDPAGADQQERSLVSLVTVADHLAAAHGGGFRLDIVDTTVPPGAADFIGLSAETLARIVDRIPMTLEEIDQQLAV